MICVSLGNIGFDECVRALNKAEFAEIRIDLLDFSDEQFKKIFAAKKNSLATCRPDKHSEKLRISLLKMAIEAGAGYVDIEYESEESYRNQIQSIAKSTGTKTIISYHNFDKTPSLAELEQIIAQSERWGADFVKIAVMANSQADCARVMGLYDKHKNLIAFCMGKIGAVTRVAAPLLGSEFTFAALDGPRATAPGQLTIGELIDIYDTLN